MSILHYFSHSTSSPRQNQIQALEWLERQTAKYIILQAPVGSGKSHIAVTYAQFIAKGQNIPNVSYILTTQKVLQKQYEDSFVNTQPPIMATLYGKGNYQCVNRNTTCDVGGLMKPRCSACPYDIAKAFTKTRPHVVLNYKLALLLLGFTTVFKHKRQLMIFDECHNMESELTEFDAVVVSKKRCEKYNLPYKEFSDITKAFTWLKGEYAASVDDIISELMNRYEDILDERHHSHTADDIKKIRELNALTEHAATIGMLVADTSTTSIVDDFVMIIDPSFIKFKRLSAAHSFEKIFGDQAEQFLFMSSTILDKDQFCRDLGINVKETAFLSLDSDFPKEHRPIFFMPVMKMNASWKNDENKSGRSNMLSTIKMLINEHHSDESGIIHTANFAVAKWLTDELKGKIPHDIFQHNPDGTDERGRSIVAFQQSTRAGLLISPSITEGLDLAGDQSRFAIIAKVGFPSLGDVWIKRKMELSQRWYLRQTLIDVIQASGRVVRHKEDWGTVYILDSSFGFLKNQTIDMIPGWWLEAYQQVY